MKTIRTLFAVAVIAALAPVTVEAQIPLSIEASVGAVVPTGDFAEDLSAGFGFGVNAAYRVMPMLDVLAGYSWQRFGVDAEDANDADVDDAGFMFGARFNAPMPGINPWVRGGVIMHQMKMSAEGMSFDFDRATGFEVGAGATFAVAPRISVVPSVTYRQYTAKMEVMGFAIEEDVSYFGANVGVRFTL
jgi:opacity protein-like surface antigen